jgi:hypothetical protein
VRVDVGRPRRVVHERHLTRDLAAPEDREGFFSPRDLERNAEPPLGDEKRLFPPLARQEKSGARKDGARDEAERGQERRVEARRLEQVARACRVDRALLDRAGLRRA